MRLEELTNKYKNNSKLSNVDTEECIALISQKFLDNDENTMKYVCTLPEQMGVKAFMDAYKKCSNKEIIVNNICNYKEYDGKSHAYKRLVVIIKKLLITKSEQKDIKKLLYQLSKLVYKKEVVSPKQSISIYNEIVRDCSKLLFNLNSENLETEEIYNISKMMTYVIFCRDTTEIVSKNIQANTLQWLLFFKKEVSFNEKEDNMIIESISNWDEVIVREIPNEVSDAYGKYFIEGYKLKQKKQRGVGQSLHNEVTVVKQNIKEEIPTDMTKLGNKLGTIRNSSQEEKSISQIKTIQSKGLVENYQKAVGDENVLVEINTAMHILKKSAITIQALKAENLSNKQGIDKLDKNLQQKDELISGLKEKIRYLENKINEKEDENRLISLKLLKKEEQCKELKEKVETIIKLDSNSLNHEFEAYKNKLASILRMEYKDFKEIQNEDMSMDLGENLRDQLNEVFNKLMKSDIKL
ncbi:hypothetical protein QTL86_16800 [Cellulosilyticum sp. ST5]|uniref:hypothetical protein n=1 Tax=Cellulosilyticum sp. ST5 TaxID=3055805 RepID=UPI003977D44F